MCPKGTWAPKAERIYDQKKNRPNTIKSLGEKAVAFYGMFFHVIRKSDGSGARFQVETQAVHWIQGGGVFRGRIASGGWAVAGKNLATCATGGDPV